MQVIKAWMGVEESVGEIFGENIKTVEKDSVKFETGESGLPENRLQ